MPSIHDDLLDEFHERIAAADEVSDVMAGQLRELLARPGKLRADDFAQVFSPPSEEEIP